MRNNSFLLFTFYSLLFTLLVGTVKAQQRFNTGIIAGFSASQVDGDGYLGFNKAGLIGGGFVNTDFNDIVMGQFEIIYIQKGSKKIPNHEKGDYIYYLLKLNYIEIPVLIKIKHKKFTYETGLSFGRLLKGKEYEASGEFVSVGPFNKSEFAFNLGINYTVFKKLKINWRYTRSMLPIRDTAVIVPRWGIVGGSYNTVLSFTLRYQFIKNNN